MAGGWLLDCSQLVADNRRLEQARWRWTKAASEAVEQMCEKMTALAIEVEERHEPADKE